MDIQDVLQNLCYYDSRNPDNPLDKDDQLDYDSRNKKVNCYCDNCFYGRDRLANEILRLKELYENMIHKDL